MNRNNENYTFLFVTLGLLTAFGPFVTDFYLPALPALADYFRSSASMAQMSLTTGMFGLAVGQVFIGPISDRYGRRMPLLVSMAAFIVATALCIVVPNIYLFNLLRLFQGFTAAGGIVLARSIATDMYTGNELTRFIAMISAVNGVAPVVAPVVGGMLLDFTSWKGTFVLLLLVGAAQVDDVGAVYAHEGVGGQRRFHVFEPVERGERLAFGRVDAHVFAHAFQVDDVLEFDQRDHVVGLDREKFAAVLRQRDAFRRLFGMFAAAADEFGERFGPLCGTVELLSLIHI